MGGGKWTRYGRGGCEGYSFDVGSGYMRFNSGVSRKLVTPGTPEAWTANINGRAIGGDHASKDAAQEAVERELWIAMQSALEDWLVYCAQKRMQPLRVWPSGA